MDVTHVFSATRSRMTEAEAVLAGVRDDLQALSASLCALASVSSAGEAVSVAPGSRTHRSAAQRRFPRREVGAARSGVRPAERGGAAGSWSPSTEVERNVTQTTGLAADAQRLSSDANGIVARLAASSEETEVGAKVRDIQDDAGSVVTALAGIGQIPREHPRDAGRHRRWPDRAGGRDQGHPRLTGYVLGMRR